MYINDTHHFPKFTFLLNGAANPRVRPREQCGIAVLSILGACSMHDLLIAIVFVVMIASPAIVAAIPRNDSDDDT
jgi:hypothetical protein